MEFPNQDLNKNPMLDLRYEIEINARPANIFPWIKQPGYHQGGWYVDTGWDVFKQKYFWLNIVPEEACGKYQPTANQILPEYQDLIAGDIAPQFVYRTRHAPKGAFCWAFIPNEMVNHHTHLISWWRSAGSPKTAFYLIKPLITPVDRAHQKEILKGLDKRVESKPA